MHHICEQTNCTNVENKCPGIAFYKRSCPIFSSRFTSQGFMLCPNSFSIVTESRLLSLCFLVIGNVYEYLQSQQEKIPSIALNLCSYSRLYIFMCQSDQLDILFQHLFVVMFYGEVNSMFKAIAHLFICQLLWLRLILVTNHKQNHKCRM